jgi:MSHA biogenesis protein MshG
VPFFAYKGRNARGELMQGVLEAADSGAVADQLFNTGVTPIEIVVTKAAAGDGESWWAKLLEKKVTSMDVQLFSRQMYTLLKSGVPIMRGLAGLQESAVSKAFGKVIKDLRESLDAGRELSAAMRRHPEVFTPFYLSMVRVGEMTGRLEEVFLRLFDHLEFDRDMRERVKTATRYPTFVVIAMVIAMIVVNIFRDSGVRRRVRQVWRRAAADDADPDRHLQLHGALLAGAGGGAGVGYLGLSRVDIHPKRPVPMGQIQT